MERATLSNCYFSIRFRMPYNVTDSTVQIVLTKKYLHIDIVRAANAKTNDLRGMKPYGFQSNASISSEHVCILRDYFRGMFIS